MVGPISFEIDIDCLYWPASSRLLGEVPGFTTMMEAIEPKEGMEAISFSFSMFGSKLVLWFLCCLSLPPKVCVELTKDLLPEK